VECSEADRDYFGCIEEDVGVRETSEGRRREEASLWAGNVR
jgi:hypothetical protein